MQNSNVNTPVQAVPLIEGKINKGAGNYNCSSVIHCETDGSITLEKGTVYLMVAGMDRAYSGPFEITAGTFTFD